MDKKIKQLEISGYLDLAEEFLENAEILKNQNRFRGAIDDGYNALELSAKGLILLKSDGLPRRHSGVIQRFSELYVKPEILPREIGRKTRQSLRIRNLARYDPKAELTKEQVNEILNLASKLIEVLEEKL